MGPGAPIFEIVSTDPQLAIYKRGLKKFLQRAGEVAGVNGGCTVCLSSDVAIRTLNSRYRHQDVATDVLSFPADSPAQRFGTGLGGGKRRKKQAARVDGGKNAAVCGGEKRHADATAYLGDIIISVDTARRQAMQRGHVLAQELRILALHGLLHLAGYDHEHDRGEMKAVEEKIRRVLGLKDGLIARSELPEGVQRLTHANRSRLRRGQGVRGRGF